MSAGRITRRLVYTLALIPIVPVTSFLATVATKSFAPTAIEELRLFHGIFAGLWVILTLFLWRSFILWTVGRAASNGFILAVPFVQFVYPIPLWTTPGCFNQLADSTLRTAQHTVGIGIYTWLAVWAWWGGERLFMNEQVDKLHVKKPVSKTARRIVVAIGSIPFVVGCFAITTAALERFAGLDRTTPWGITVGFWVASLVAISTWLMIWGRIVVWSPTVIGLTIVSTVLAFGIPGAGPMLTSGVWSRTVTDIFLIWSPVICWGLWMAGTVTFWPMRTDTIPSGWLIPRCRKCGYLLSGLRATRCPECGDEPTLDELWLASAGEVV